MTKLDEISDRIRNREIENSLQLHGATAQDLLGLSLQQKEILLRKIRDRRRYEGMQNMYVPPEAEEKT